MAAPQGNDNATRSKPFYEQLRRIIAQEELTLVEKNRRLYKVANVLISRAAKGEDWAIKELANRLDGKAIQGVELAGADGKPLNVFDAAMMRNMDPKKVDTLRELLGELGAKIDK